MFWTNRNHERIKTSHSYKAFLVRSEACCQSGADKFFKKAAEIRDLLRPVIGDFVKMALDRERLPDDVLDDLLHRGAILKEIVEMKISMNRNHRASLLSAQYNLLTHLGSAR